MQILETANETHLISHQLADFARAGVSDRKNFDQQGILDIFGLACGESRIESHAPVRAEPDKRLDRDDGSAPHKRPFRAANVLLVEILGEIVSKKDGPDNGKGPDVGVEVEWQRTKQFRMLNLRIVHEGCHGRQTWRRAVPPGGRWKGDASV